jgi:hypothetical protein
MSDCGKFDLVTVRDGMGADVLRYLRLCDGRFFGGNTWDRTDGFESGIHVMRTLGGMLDIIGQIANSPLEHRALAYTLDGAHWTTRIGREMSATDIAKALSCEPGQVLEHFAPLVSLADSRGTEG